MTQRPTGNLSNSARKFSKSGNHDPNKKPYGRLLQLMEMGVTNIYREHLQSSIRWVKMRLKNLASVVYCASIGTSFQSMMNSALKILAKDKNDEKKYISVVKLQSSNKGAFLSWRLTRKILLNDQGVG